MLGYNGSIPGPTLHVDQDSEVTIEATNLGDVDATLHWHGLRLENRYDGVPEETQAPIPQAASSPTGCSSPTRASTGTTRTSARTSPRRWASTRGSSSSPSDPDYWPPVDRQLAITLDDILIEDGQIAPFDRSGPTFTAMGRFGNVMLTNGETEYRAEAKVGEVVRLHLVDTANTRIFNFAHHRCADEAGRRRQRPRRARGVHRRGPAFAVRAGHRRRPLRPARRGDPREPHARPHLRARPHHRLRRSGRRGGGGVRRAADRSRALGRARANPGRPRARAGQDPGLRLADADPLRLGAERGIALRLPDASGGHRHGGLELSQVRDEAGPRRVGADLICLPDAPGGDRL